MILARERAASRPTAARPRRALWLVAGMVVMVAQSLGSVARAAPEGFADVVERVSGAVVNITTTTVVAEPAIPAPIVPEGSPLEEFFKDFLDRQKRERKRRAQALGSGFVISADGYIVTNNHVIDKADEIQVEFFSGDVLDAKVVGTDPKTDIALLKVESDKPLVFVTFGDSDKARVGDWVLAMGNPLGQGFSASAGIVSARNRALSGAYDDFIQTDAAINRGNSGGPLFNMDGEVIGVNTAILSPDGGSIGIGFSMASNVVRPVVEQLMKYGETRRGWLGVRIQDVTPDVAEAMGLDAPQGALVTDVPPGPAAEAGMEPGDVIVEFAGRKVDDSRTLVRIVGDTEPGKTVKVKVFRKGKEVELDVTLGRREEAEAAMPEPGAKPAEAEVLGLTVMTLTDELRSELGLPPTAEGLVVVDVDEASTAYEKGIRAGDVIVEAGQEKVTTPAELRARVKEARDGGRKSILLLIRRQGEPRFVALPVE
ncbi:MAG: DegQ family serine endoprotease [Alphaproteobacteria bacterium]|nr:MAG: DegQ family serine endoprotease [Alphaproteobacteria bacterium]